MRRTSRSNYTNSNKAWRTPTRRSVDNLMKRSSGCRNNECTNRIRGNECSHKLGKNIWTPTMHRYLLCCKRQSMTISGKSKKIIRRNCKISKTNWPRCWGAWLKCWGLIKPRTCKSWWAVRRNFLLFREWSWSPSRTKRLRLFRLSSRKSMRQKLRIWRRSFKKNGSKPFKENKRSLTSDWSQRKNKFRNSMT